MSTRLAPRSRRPRPHTLRSVCNESTDDAITLRLAVYAALQHMRRAPDRNTMFAKATLTILRRALRQTGGAR